jgi:flagellar biosynthetic protein FliR
MPSVLLEDLANWSRLPGVAAAVVLVLFAALRWFGMFLTLPMLSQALTLRLRIALSLALAVVALPALAGSSHAVLDLFSAAGTAHDLTGWLVAHGTRLLVAGAAEFGIGAALGLGVRCVLSGVQAAGELVDQQAGLAFAQVFHPGTNDDGTPMGQALVLTAVAVFLLLAPFGGHLVLTASMLELFDSFPVASALTPRPVIDLLIVLGQQSFLLALHVAAPLLAVMSLVTVATAWLGRSAPALGAAHVLAPLRIVTCLLILLVSMSGVTGMLADRFESLLDQAPALLSFTNPP